MRKFLTLCVCAIAISLAGCQSSQTPEADNNNGISDDVLAQVRALGFSTTGMSVVEGGYLVEGDIFLSKESMQDGMQKQLLRVGNEEQYRTTNLVRGLPRTITIYVSIYLPSAYVTAVDEAIRRYNAEGLLLTFRRTTSSSSYNIFIGRAPSGATYLASAGFPTSSGNPHNQILVNSAYLGSNPGTNYLATILAHEIGHCIGFRHTDYMNRQYSCGGSFYNEGASTVGAILIPGTPSGPDPNSWMLACIGTGVNRPFNSNDRTALNYLY